MPSRIQIEPREIETTGGYGPVLYWRILIDGVEAWSNAKPFSASESAIVANECLDCATCGNRSVLVRRTGSFVVWFGKSEYPCELGRGAIRVFAATNYQEQVGSGVVAELPLLQRKELARLLGNTSTSNPSDALYRIPDSDFDPSGRLALRAIQDSLASRDATVEIVEEPASFQEIRIGLEIPEVPECVWRFARESNVDRFYFEANPSFPVWITSESLRRNLGKYTN